MSHFLCAILEDAEQNDAVDMRGIFTVVVRVHTEHSISMVSVSLIGHSSAHFNIVCDTNFPS